MDFGKWIFVAFVLFGLFIATLVTVCVNQNINLVSTNYYQEELAHQQKINLIHNTQTLEVAPEITLNDGTVSVTFRAFDKLEKGELYLLRPSDELLDHKFPLYPAGNEVQQFTLPHWQKGLYRVSMQWTMEGKDFYYEKLIVM